MDDFPALSARVKRGRFTCYDLVKCMFNLNETDIALLKVLKEKKPLTPGESAELVGKDRSTSYRSLEKLVSCGLAYKERKGGKSRGYSNVYRRLPVREMNQKAEQLLDECYAKTKARLKEMAEKG